MNRNKRAFTLIELLVVVLIIAILAAVALPQYQKAVDKARIKGILPVMRAIVNAENLYRLEHGDYTLNWEELGLEIPHTQLSSSKSMLYLQKGGLYQLSCDGSYCHVKYWHKDDWARVYAAFQKELWLCYPQGTDRGKALCKSLGCAENKLNGQYCGFKP